MKVNQHRYRNVALAILALVPLGALFVALQQFNRYRIDVRYAHDIVLGFHFKRDLALNAAVPDAVQYLEQLDFPEGQASPFSGSLSNFVETERRRDIHDIIVYLRTKTGKDLGDTPEAWIHEYGAK